MIEKVGIIFLDKNEIIFRIYEVDQHEWKLLLYQSMQPTTHEERHAAFIIESLADFLTKDEGSHISEWKIAARGLPQTTIQEISTAIGMNIETLGLLREQEILCKGLFTELW